ncbi:hypothetical protein [Clostridium tarantellae]|uniref:Uncharacterized protein n=1 Tax=Clostridium tarantellae TaxID=39493 RepID=A0A6I1MMI2_9CLOT|nr:hypothetical protein [Clostridium tarantellae]MPQ44214.1 hypothetical protein [Clostridium tarantellae]
MNEKNFLKICSIILLILSITMIAFYLITDEINVFLLWLGPIIAILNTWLLFLNIYFKKKKYIEITKKYNRFLMFSIIVNYLPFVMIALAIFEWGSKA